MSRNPYHDYSSSSSSGGSEANHYDNNRKERSHWSLEEGVPTASRGNFLEKFSPPASQHYEPSIRSSVSDVKSQTRSQPWTRRNSVPYSESGSSLPSYHDNSEARYQESQKLTNSIRGQLDAGNRARVYLFIAMCLGMLLIFLFAALVWLKLDIIKKKPVYGLDNKANYTVRQSTVI